MLFRDLWEWIDAIVHQVAALVTGGILMALITGVQWWREKSFGWNVNKWLLAFFLFLAFFLAWRDKNKELTKVRADLNAERQNNLPNLAGTLEQTVTAENGTSAMGLIQVSIRNRGADSIVEHYTCTIITPSKKLSGIHAYIPSQNLLDPSTGQTIQLQQSEDLWEKTLSPIPRGGLKRGWLLFQFADLASAELTKPGVKWVVTYDDVDGKTWSFEHVYGAKDTKGLRYYPGLDGLPHP